MSFDVFHPLEALTIGLSTDKRRRHFMAICKLESHKVDTPLAHRKGTFPSGRRQKEKLPKPEKNLPDIFCR